MEGSEPLRRKTYQFEREEMHPSVHSARSNEMQLTPRILRFIRLLPSPAAFCCFYRAFGSSGYEYLYPTVAVQSNRPICPPYFIAFPVFPFFLPFFLSFFSHPSSSFSTRFSRDTSSSSSSSLSRTRQVKNSRKLGG